MSAAAQACAVDDQRLGALLRVLRIRRGLRQADVAVLAGVSDVTVSRAGRGHLDSLSVAILRRIARVLEARVDIRLWTRFGDAERLASRSHAELVESLITTLVAAGWSARPEVSFNVAGERGFIDIVAWHEATRALLLIEVKTEIVDVGELFGTFDRKRRLGPAIARQLGLDPAAISTALVVADTPTNHRRIRAHAATFGAALPHGGQRFRSFIERPAGAIHALAYWSTDIQGRQVVQPPALDGFGGPDPPLSAPFADRVSAGTAVQGRAKAPRRPIQATSRPWVTN